MNQSLKLSAWVALTSLLWFCAALVYHVTRPSFGSETLVLSGQPPRQFAYPLFWKKAPKEKFLLIQHLQLPPCYPTTFEFYPQDFLWSLRVNGHEIPAIGLPLSSSSHEGRSIDLAPFLHPGRNEIELQMEVRWGEARSRMCVSPWDRYSLILLVFLSSAAIGTAASLCLLYRVTIVRAEIALVLGGMFLRYIYALGTPYFIRSYDYWGHVDYMDYVIRNLGLPPPGSNWEAFQPPLYYVLVGGVTRFLLALGMPEDQRYALWQGLSLVFSIAVLLTGYRIAHLLYENDARGRLLVLAVVAVAPPLVFNSARISNDSLVTLLEFLWLVVLVSYWRQPAKIIWWWLSVVTGLALLTKANALALVLISGICVFIDNRIETKTRTYYLIVLLACSCGIGGWYYILKAAHATSVDVYVAGNVRSLTEQAHIDGVFLKSLIFNPFKIIRYPFDEPWGPRHDYFLEVFFKTMLLGEWIKGASYKFLARSMMVVSLLLIPPFILGLGSALKQMTARDWPLLITLGTVFSAHWLFLQTAPFLSTQDFRYSVILLVPMTHFFLRGVNRLSAWWKTAAIFVLQVAILNSAIYVLVLSLGD